MPAPPIYGHAISGRNHADGKNLRRVGETLSYPFCQRQSFGSSTKIYARSPALQFPWLWFGVINR